MKKVDKRITSIMMAVLIAFIAQTASGVWPISQTMAASIPSDAVYYNGHAYKLYNDLMTWDEAKIFCESLGGHLVTITSEQEQSIMDSILENANLQYEGYWMGAYYQESFNWQWITGELYEYEHFSSGEPNGSGHYMQTFTSGKWDDTTVDGTGNAAIHDHGLICEWDNINVSEQLSDRSNATITALHNYAFTYNSNNYISTVYDDFVDNSGWNNVQEATIKSGSFDWISAITSTISMNGGAYEDKTWEKSKFNTDPNNDTAISGLDSGMNIIQLVNGFVTGGRSGITDIYMKLQKNVSSNRMLLLYGSPIEYAYAGKTLWLHEVLTNAHAGDAAYFLWAGDDEDKIIRSCFDGLEESGTYSMKITYANMKSIEKCPYKYSIVISDDMKVYQYPILHEGTKMEVYYKPDGETMQFAFDATQLVNSEKIEINEQVGSDIISFLTAGEWMSNSGDWLNSLQTQTISGTKNYNKTIGCKPFSLNAKAKTSLSYVSEHPSVASVDATGKVTVHSVGKTTITITAAQTNKYTPATRKVTVTINPKPTKIYSTKRTENSKATAAWEKRSDIDGYKIQLSKNTRFSSPKTFSISGQSKTSIKFKNLTAKKTYYVRVCTYKDINGTIYQSNWSNYKSIKKK